MKNQILIILLLLLSIGLISAIGNLPHGFYGNITYSDGSLIHENLTITAELNEFEDTCIIQNGTYGYGSDTLIVSGDGGEINFFIEGLDDSIKTISFEPLNVTELNFMTSLINSNSTIENNDSLNNTESNNSSSTSSSSGSSSGGGSISNNEYIDLDTQKESSFGSFGSLNLNQNSPINNFVMRFVNYGPIITFIFLIGILILLLIIIKKKKAK